MKFILFNHINYNNYQMDTYRNDYVEQFKKKNDELDLCIDINESKPVKLETSHTLIFPLQ